MKHIIKHHKTYQMTQKLPEKKAKISETQEQQPKTRRIPENIPKHQNNPKDNKTPKTQEGTTKNLKTKTNVVFYVFLCDFVGFRVFLHIFLFGVDLFVLC